MIHSNRRIPMLAAAAATVGLALLVAPLATTWADVQPRAVAPLQDSRLADELSLAFERVAQSIKPSLVSITTARRVETRGFQRIMPQPFLDDQRLREFFGGENPFERFGFRFFEAPPQPTQPFVQQGQGSGVIVSRDGYILTNNHVVAGADEVTVTLQNERRYAARVIGTDPKTDLAVIQINADESLTPAVLGDSDALRVGQWVVAAGSPFGLNSSITAGIVSAVGRSRMGIADYEDFIQTDAAINPGNSGGPLVNLKGEVVGISTAIVSRTGVNLGVGFAIPVNMARQIMDELIRDGKVVRGWLGVAIQNLDEDLAASFNYDGADGALVGDVNRGSPAEKAGVQPGDIITAINGRPVASVERLRNEVALLKPGANAELTIFRDGRTRTLKVEIGEQPADLAARPAGQPSTSDDLGMALEPLSRDLARQLNLDRSTRGVVITQVDPLSPAGRAGLRARDVIVEVNGEPVESPEQVRRQLERGDLEKGVRLTVLSDGLRRFVILKSQP